MKTGLITFYDTENLAVRILHSVLKKEKIDVSSIFIEKQIPHASEKSYTDKEISILVDYVEKEKFEIIGFSVRSFTFHLTKRISNKLKNLKDLL